MGDAYFPLDGNGGIDVRRYSIHDRYDFGRGRLTGWTRLKIRATQHLRRFNLDLLLNVSAVTVDGRRAAFHKSGPHELRIRPSARVRRGDDVHRGRALRRPPRARSVPAASGTGSPTAARW